MTAQGSCLCGAVRYEVDGSLGEVRYCHCRSCRKLTGTAFTAKARIPASVFRLLTGTDSLSEYRTARAPPLRAARIDDASEEAPDPPFGVEAEFGA